MSPKQVNEKCTCKLEYPTLIFFFYQKSEIWWNGRVPSSRVWATAVRGKEGKTTKGFTTFLWYKCDKNLTALVSWLTYLKGRELAQTMVSMVVDTQPSTNPVHVLESGPFEFLVYLRVLSSWRWSSKCFIPKRVSRSCKPFLCHNCINVSPINKYEFDSSSAAIKIWHQAWKERKERKFSPENMNALWNHYFSSIVLKSITCGENHFKEMHLLKTFTNYCPHIWT